ncbi:MAG: hypothetical protein RR603_06560, partial [Kurthia sp.]
MQLFEVPVGAREKFLDLLIIADEDESIVRGYMNDGRLFEINEEQQRVGVIQVIDQGSYTEIKNIAITSRARGDHHPALP